MDRKFSLPDLSRFRAPQKASIIVRLLISGLFLFQPLVSCSSDTDKPQIVRSTSVPDDGYRPPQKAKKIDKQKPKVVSFRKHEPVSI